tara:strand:+ start:3257 stop:3682 length:426 start_codon:yes stop_codon:yes gene_type:complete
MYHTLKIKLKILLKTIMSINIDYGAYIYQYNDTIHTFLYTYMDPTELRHECLISNIEDNNYICILYTNECVYKHPLKITAIQGLIKEYCMVDVISTPYDKLKKRFNCLTLEKYNESLNLALYETNMSNFEKPHVCCIPCLF